MLAPVDAICAAKSARPPGRSLMTALNRPSRPSATRPRSITRLSTLGSMLPPQINRTTRLPASSFNFPDMHTASGVAAAPSTTLFSNSTRRRIARAICSSVTVTARLTSGFAIRNAFEPTSGMASPSANVGCIAIFVGLPASSAAEKLAAFSASTATMFTFGRKVLIAKETPASRPAPPTGIITASRSGVCSTISSPIVP